MKNIFLFLIIFLVFLLYAVPYTSVSMASSKNGAAISKEEASRKLLKLRIPFVENRGQVNEDVSYYAKTFGGTLFVTKDGDLVYTLIKAEGGGEEMTGTLGAVKTRAEGCVVRESFVEGKVSKVSGEKEAATRVSYFRGRDPGKWKKDIKTYEEVSLGEIYHGIELKLKAHGNNVEKLFYVAPGASPDVIGIKVEGTKGLKTGKDGSLVLETELGLVSFTRPVAFQIIDGKKVDIGVRYEVRKGNLYAFDISKYDTTKELVIDPFLQSTYLGGNRFDSAWAMSINPTTGDVYVTGNTSSSDFPGVEAGALDHEVQGWEIFVSKLSSDLNTLHQSTYLSGSSDDYGRGIAVHPTGDVYVAGYTFSSDFPGVDENSADYTFSLAESFVTRLDSTLTTLHQSTYLGGNSYDYSRGLSINPATGDVYVVGGTESDDFPGVNENSPDNTFASREAYVSRLDGSLATIHQSTYLGGSDYNFGRGITIHPITGDVYVAGNTNSDDFPGVNENSPDNIFAGGNEVFVSRLDGSLATLHQSTYLGGSSYDLGYSIAIYPATDDVYVSGGTHSSDFPGVDANSADKTFAGGAECYVSRLNSALTTLYQSTFLGGSDFEEERGDIALYPVTGDVYVTGYTNSSDFPGVDANSADKTFAGGAEAFLSKLNNSLTVLLQSTYIGGSDVEAGRGIAIYPVTGDVYVSGYTNSSDFPGVDANSADKTFAYDFSGLGPSSADNTMEDYESFVTRLDTLTAIYFTLEVTRSGIGAGKVTSVPAGIDCGEDCSEDYPDGTVVTLTADPDPGSGFTAWSGACSSCGTNPTCAVTMDADKACDAEFTISSILNALEVTRSGIGAGKVTSVPAGIDCGEDCSEDYPDGTVVTLTADPDPGSGFTVWSGACSSCGTNPTCAVTMDADKACDAEFTSSTVDLTGSWVDFRMNNQRIRAILRIQNVGTTEYHGLMDVDIYYSMDVILDPGDTFIVRRTVNLPGTYADYIYRDRRPSEIDPLFVIAVIDPLNNISEINEDNNIVIGP